MLVPSLPVKRLAIMSYATHNHDFRDLDKIAMLLVLFLQLTNLYQYLNQPDHSMTEKLL